QVRALGSRGPIGRSRISDLADCTLSPCLGGRMRESDLARRLRRRQDGDGRGRQRVGQQRVSAQSAFTAFRTSSTSPGTFTLRQRPRITPFPSMRNVERSIPMYLRPYMLFSTQTPYFLATAVSSSEASVNGSLYFFLNLSCEAGLSLETPI